MASEKNNTCSGAPNPGASCVPSTDTDCAATTGSSHPPLMPCASGGLVDLTVRTVSTTYVMSAHNPMPANHSAAPTRHIPPSTRNWLPSTHVAATIVKNPTDRP